MSIGNGQDPLKIETLNTVRDIISKILCLEIDSVQPEKVLVLELQADSIDIIDVFYRVESHFKIKIDYGALPDDLRKNRINLTVKDVAMIVHYTDSENE